ncbi:MAG: carboxypeptidase-like regulatory domain-containing protein [Ignavibacteria bacterium]|nr:carboxypeptidase-like regulatory domain-containing protein [Ignavibacteria bacterium]
MIVALLYFAPFSFQPQSSTGTIRGTVTSESTGERIVHAKVSLDDQSFSTYTDGNGAYRLAKIPGGVYSLTISAPWYARLTFRGLIVPQYTPLVIDAKLRDAATSSDSVIVVRFPSMPAEQHLTEDKMKFYQPDSTVDYKIRIAKPAPPSRRPRSFSVPDSSRKHK